MNHRACLNFAELVLLVLLSGMGGVLLGGCSGEVAALCDPGAMQSCPCPAGGEGVQYCRSDGTSWLACERCSAEGEGEETPICVPGQTQACLCPGGHNGAQVCAADRRGWQPCECELPEREGEGEGAEGEGAEGEGAEGEGAEGEGAEEEGQGEGEGAGGPCDQPLFADCTWALGVCRSAIPSCEPERGWFCEPPQPVPFERGDETLCDQLDNDCDGQVDEDAVCGDPCLPDPCSGNGQCSAGECSCNPGYSGDHCQECAPGWQLLEGSCLPDDYVGDSGGALDACPDVVLRPVAQGTAVTCNYICHGTRSPGIDFAAAMGSPINAPVPGTVVTVVNGKGGRPANATAQTPGCSRVDGGIACNISDGFGNYVVIKDRKLRLWYLGHMVNGSILVRVGDMVVPGQPVGSMGNSGYTISENGNGVHVHLSVKVAGSWQDFTRCLTGWGNGAAAIQCTDGDLDTYGLGPGCDSQDCDDAEPDFQSWNREHTGCLGGEADGQVCSDRDGDQAMAGSGCPWPDEDCDDFDASITDGCQRAQCNCQPGTARCEGGNVVRCTADGCRWEVADTCECSCADGVCRDRTCNAGARRCAGDASERCADDGCSWESIDQCGCGCSDGWCTDRVCQPGASRCSQDGDVETCSAEGCRWSVTEPCPAGCEAGRCRQVACVNGQRQRCWVECVQEYAAGCIHTDSPPRIMGISTCSNGQWGACAVSASCRDLGPEACVPNNHEPVTFECVDGGQRTGEMLCMRPLGANCASSYYTGWGITECVAHQQQLCLGAGDTCAPGQTRVCEVHCDTADGPTRPGTQNCFAADCGGGLGRINIWGPCNTQDGCLH